jgi:hypothetical protein
MKHSLILFLLPVVLAFSGSCCDDDNDPALDRSLLGMWELEFKTGGFQPAQNFLKGNGNIIHITRKTIHFYRDGALETGGSYTFRVSESYNDGLPMYDINVEGAAYPRKIGIREGKLILEDGPLATDGTLYRYAKCSSCLPD